MWQMTQSAHPLKGMCMPPSVVDSGQVAPVVKHWVISIGLFHQLLFQIPLLRWLSLEVASHVFGLWGLDVPAYITSAPVLLRGTIFGRRLRPPLTELSDDAVRSY